MTDDDRLTIERAQQDIEQIKRLQEFAPFTIYFVRRLKMKQAAIRKKFEYDPPAKVDKEEREILRRLMLEYDEILSMMESDMAGAQRTLGG